MPLINIKDAQIKTAAVEIKTLTISGKQVTLSVFRQIEEENIIDEETMKFNGIPWGQVNYFWKEEYQDYKLHILWQKGNELRRCILLEKAKIKLDDRNIYTNKYLELYNKIFNIECMIDRIVNLYPTSYIEPKYINKFEYIKTLEKFVDDRRDTIKDIKEGRSAKDLLKVENELNQGLQRIEELKNIIKVKLDEKFSLCNLLESYEEKYNKLLELLSDLPHLFIAI